MSRTDPTRLCKGRPAAKPTREGKGCETVPLPPDVFEVIVAALSDALLADLQEFPLRMGGSPSGPDHTEEAA